MSEAQIDAPAPPPPSFDSLPLSPELRKAIDAMGYKHPTPVQRAVFEPAVRGRSLVVQARTGTGKTAAFGLPILDQLVRRSTPKAQALVLTPTRELALQVAHELEKLAQFRGVTVTAVYGGAPMGRQVEALAAGAQVVVGTPGRVLDHLRRGTFDASSIRIFVLDEADEMLSMGFAKELHAIVEMLPRERQGLFFSATIPPDIERLAIAQLKDPEFVTLSSDQIGALEVGHFVYLVPPGADKRQELVRILELEDPESAVVFCNTKDETERVTEALQNRGYDAEWLNGDLEQKERERVMTRTREGKLRFLVATDVAARGIDISHLTHVVNADFPESAEQYVHRTGRTGRAGRTGTAISLIGPKDIGNLYILRLTYNIRPIERQLPSHGELKTRAEQDVVQLFVDAFSSRVPHTDDLALARRLLTHPECERIVAGLLRDHLGARPGDPAVEAAEARRAKNPPALGETPRAPAPERKARPAPAPIPKEVRTSNATQQAPAQYAAPAPAPANIAAEVRPAPSPARQERNERNERNERSGPGQRGERAPLRPGEPRGAVKPPVDARSERRGIRQASYVGWEPAREVDDDHPILASKPDVDPVGYRVEGDAPVAPRAQAEDPNQVEVFVNVGRRENLRPEDVEQWLREGGLEQADVLGVRVRDRMTFVTVQRSALDRTLSALTGKTVSGRTLAAEPARGGGSRPRSH